MNINELLPQSEDAKFRSVPYEQRWECLKHVIVALYLEARNNDGKSLTIAQVAEFMQDNYDFRGLVHQYRARFRKWDVRKRTFTSEKKEITTALGKRSHSLVSTSDVKFTNGKGVDKKQLKRYLDDKICKDYQNGAVPIAPGVLTSWNLPYVAYVKASGKYHDQASPFGTAGTTPPYLNILSPGAASSAHQISDPSPTTKLIHHKRALDRSSLFLQGRHRELLTISSREDRITLTDYFHDFYMYSFVTAKYWGKGPRHWTPAVISALTLGSSDASSPMDITAVSPPSGPLHRRLEALQAPSQLCRWLIYAPHVYYQGIPDVLDSNPDAERDDLDPNGPNFWQEWPSDPSSSYTEVIHESITHGSFSRIPSDTLPLSPQLIKESVGQDSKAVELDAWKMAIMSGNVELLATLWEKKKWVLPEGIEDIHPFHLAATFLDGANTGCLIITQLVHMSPEMYLRKHPLDDLDHTLLDKFMINILRSHTSVHPEEVSNAFNPPHRFPGEEKSNCGRWDADSPVIRALFRNGYSRIPNDWKHAFCHTAIQAICHSSIAIYGSPLSPDIDALSGLFVRRCGYCGLQLKLGPLHALVVVTFYLAHRGMSGETLFGPLAILVCLMSIGADPLLKTNMSVEDILGTAEPDRCHHRPLDALDLMEAVPVSLQQSWTSKCHTGWLCIAEIFRMHRDRENDHQPTPRRTSVGSLMQGQLDQNHYNAANNQNVSYFDASFDQDFHHPFLDDFEAASPTSHQHPSAAVEDSPQSDEDLTSEPHHPVCQFEERMIGARLHDEWLQWPRLKHRLALLWATIQAELLTYRRIKIGDGWMSENFSMTALKNWLEGKSATFKTPLVERDMLKEYSTCCGWFLCEEFPTPTAEDVCKTHFMNMDIYDRTTFHPQQDIRETWMQLEMVEES